MKISNIRSATLLAFGTFLSIAQCPAATITQVGNAAPGQSWATAAIWSNTAAASSGNTYNTNGYSLRSPQIQATNQVFPGTSLIVDGGAGSGRGTMILKSDIATIADLQMGVGTMLSAVSFTGNNPATLNATNLTLLPAATSANAAEFVGNYSGNNLSLNVTNLIGSGYMKFVQGSDSGQRIFTLSVADATAFTGTLDLNYGTINLSSALNMASGSFKMASTNTTLTLNSSLTVSSFSFGFVSPLALGAYTSSQLNTLYSTAAFTGSGSLYVVPEPSNYALLAGVGAMTALIFRRRSPRQN